MTAESNDPEQSTVGRPFPKGVSGNPGGRSKVQVEIKEALEKAAPAALAKMIALISSEDGKIALGASKDILDRVCGKARESVEVSGDGLSDLLRALAVSKPPLEEK